MSDLKSRGFVVNPYNLFVANMMVNEKHMTITWNFNDFKISYVDSDEVTKVIDWMEGIYGSHMK